MKTCILRLVICTTSLTIPLLAAGDVSISYSLETKQPTLNEPIYIGFAIKNGTDATVYLKIASNTHGYGSFRGHLIRPDGRTDEAPRPTPDEAPAPIPALIQPGRDYRGHILLNKWFDLEKPGRYSVNIQITESGVTPCRMISTSTLLLVIRCSSSRSATIWKLQS